MTLPGHDGSCSPSHAWVPANSQACIELLKGRESATCGHPLFALPCLPCDAALGALRWCRVNWFCHIDSAPRQCCCIFGVCMGHKTTT